MSESFRPPTPKVAKFHAAVTAKPECWTVKCLSPEQVNAIVAQSTRDYVVSCVWDSEFPEAIDIELTVRCMEGPGTEYLGGVACHGEALCLIAPSEILQQDPPVANE